MFKVLLPNFKEARYNILDYGVHKDSLENSGIGINKAIDDCAKNGGGYVVIPTGIYYSSPIFLKSNVCLYFETGATIKMIKDEAYYPLYEADWEGIKRIRCTSPINIVDCENVGIAGAGFIDGAGDLWRPIKDWKLTKKEWDKRLKICDATQTLKESSVWYPNKRILEGVLNGEKKTIEEAKPYWDMYRPVMVLIKNSSKILLDGMTFSNSPAWNIHPLFSDNLTVRNCIVKNPYHAQNGDGIDIESCKNVEIVGSTFEVGDDGICVKAGKNREARSLKAPCENIYIHDCLVFEAHGGFVIGSEMSRGVRNVYVENCNFIGTDVGLRFKSALGRGGVVEDINIKNIRMTSIKEEAIILTMSYALTTIGVEGCEGTRNEDPEDIPYFKNINMDNIFCDASKKSLVVEGINPETIKDITLKNSFIKSNNDIKLKSCKNINIIDTTFVINDDKRVVNNSFTEE